MFMAACQETAKIVAETRLALHGCDCVWKLSVHVCKEARLTYKSHPQRAVD